MQIQKQPAASSPGLLRPHLISGHDVLHCRFIKVKYQELENYFAEAFIEVILYLFILFPDTVSHLHATVFVITFPPQTSAHVYHTCPPAAHPSFNVNWNPQQRRPPVTQPIRLLPPDNQSPNAARGNRSPGHVSLRSLSCNRICSGAPPPPSVTVTPLPSRHLCTSYYYLSFLSLFPLHICIMSNGETSS